MVKKKVTLSIDSKVYSNFQKYCDENAVMLSKKIEIFMDNFIKHSKGKRLTYSLFTGFFIMIALVSLASAGNPDILFVNPTPTTNVTGNSIYVNLSTNSSVEHYSFVDFDNDLVFWMRMDDVNGDVVYENSSYANHGTLINGSYLTIGYYKNATKFDGYNDQIVVPDNSALGLISLTDRITVCAWVNQTGIMTGKYAGVVGQYGNEASENNGNNRGFLLAKSSTDYKYEFMISQDGASRQGVISSTSVNLNKWYHVCGSYNGTNYLIYINGNLDNKSTSSYSSIYDSTSYLGIGNYGYRGVGYENGPAYNGSIDEVLIFKRALSLNEIRAIYNSSAYRFENNYTNLTNGSHTFTGYAVDVNGNLNYTTRTITSGNGSSENTTLQITLNSPTTQYNSFTVWISTNAAASMCWFSSNNGTTNTTMYENSSTSFYYENFAYGNYSISFYCQNVNGTGTRTDNFQFKRAYVISDHSYVNSQGLRIYFDFGFNYSAEKGPLVIIPDSWTAVKDATWVTEAENYFIARGYAAAPVDTRGKGSSEGTKDAFGYECLDIYELYQYLISNSPYNSYINSSAIYIAGASGAGGKAGVCTSKYPDAFSAGYSSVGVLNLTLWWQTAGSADVAEIVTRVGCNPNQCPEAYLNRDASYLNYNTQTPVMAVSNADDDRVTVNCSRNYNATMILNGKVVNYTEYASGGHTADFTHAHWWFSQHSAERFIPSSGSLLIGGNLHTKNFSIDLNTMNYTASVEYNLPNNSYHTFNITTFGYNKNATVKVFDLAASTNYSVSNGLSTVYIVSDNKGDINLNISLSNYSSTFIIISKVVSEYCGDGICNNGETCSSCASDCGSCPSGGRGGGGGGSRVIPVINTTIGMGIEFGIPGLEIQQISPLVINPGESRKMSASLKNIGTSFLNKCKLIGNENYSSWINSEGTKDLSIGQKAELFFSLNAPKNIKPGRYEVLLSIECQEITKNMTIGIEVIPKKLALELIGAKKDKNNNLRISYSIEELTGEKQEVNVQIVLVGFQSTRLAEVTEKKVIEGNSKITFESVLKLPTNIGEKNLNLLINANSKIASAFVQDYLILDSSSTRGFAIMEGANAGKIITVMLVVAFVVFAFFIGKRIFHLRRMHQRKDILLKISEAIMPYGQASDDKRHRYFNDDE